MRYVVTQKAQKNQQGIAAIEFGLLITLLLIMCAAIASFGMFMWTQQKVSHIAGDSTRVALQHSINGETGNALKEKACEHAYAMVAADFILGELLNLSDLSKNKVFCEAVPAECVWDEAQSCLSLTMTVTVDGLPLVNMVQVLGNVFSNKTAGWIPDYLSATSTVKITDL